MKNLKPIVLILFLLLLLCPSIVSAQDETHTAFSTQMNTIFSTLEKNRVPYGLLKDFSFEFAELSNYNGILTDTNMVSTGILRDIYSTIVMTYKLPCSEAFMPNNSRIYKINTIFVKYYCHKHNVFLSNYSNEQKGQTKRYLS